MRHRGFTLLELILAMVLMATLLMAAWSLLGIFRDRVERSQRDAEQRQLVRSLQQTLADDLRSGCHTRLDTARFASSASGSTASTSDSSSTTDDQTSDASGESENDSESGSNPADATPTPTQASGDAPLLASPPDRRDPQAAGALDDSLRNRLLQQDNTGLSSTNWSSAALSPSDRLLSADWQEPGPLLVGTSDALVMDKLMPAMPGEAQRPAMAPPIESANIPDRQRRVIYVFTPPGGALLTDRPPGLVRCELTQRQILSLQSMVAATDFLTLVRPRLPIVGPDAAANLSTEDGDSLATAAELPAPLSSPSDTTSSTLATAATDDQSLGEDTTNPADVLDLSQQIDYVPEAVTFQLRYHDGGSWRSSWDSRREEGRLPVAVEVRFRLQSELPKPTEDEAVGEGSDPLAGDTGAANDALQALHEAPAEEPLDDRLRSAQTEPPDDHRYVIVLRDTENKSGLESSLDPFGAGAAGSSGDAEPMQNLR